MMSSEDVQGKEPEGYEENFYAILTDLIEIERQHRNICLLLNEMDLPDEWKHWSAILVDQIYREVIIDLERERLRISHAIRLDAVVVNFPTQVVKMCQQRLMQLTKEKWSEPPPITNGSRGEEE
jgi:hypothetical protein